MDSQINEGLRAMGASQEGRNAVAGHATFADFWLQNRRTDYQLWLVDHTPTPMRREVLGACIELVDTVLVFSATAPSPAHAVVVRAKDLFNAWDEVVGKGRTQPLVVEIAGLGQQARNEAQRAGGSANGYVQQAAAALAAHIVEFVSTGSQARSGYLGTVINHARAAADTAERSALAGAFRADEVVPGVVRKYVPHEVIAAALIAAGAGRTATCH